VTCNITLAITDKNGRSARTNAGTLILKTCIPDCSELYVGPWSGSTPTSTWGSFNPQSRTSKFKLGGVKHCFPNNLQFRAPSTRPWLGPRNQFRGIQPTTGGPRSAGNSSSVSTRTMPFGGLFSGVSCNRPAFTLADNVMSVPATQCSGPGSKPWASLLPQQWSWGFEFIAYDKVSGLFCRKQLTCPFAWSHMSGFGCIKKCW
jgi:hypothetical protein